MAGVTLDDAPTRHLQHSRTPRSSRQCSRPLSKSQRSEHSDEYAQYDADLDADIVYLRRQHQQLRTGNALLRSNLGQIDHFATLARHQNIALANVLQQLRPHKAAFELAPDGQLADAAAALAEVDMDEREASGQAVALHLSATGGFPPALSGDGRDGSAVGSKRRRTDKEGRPIDHDKARCEYEDREERDYAKAELAAAAALQTNGGDVARAIVDLLNVYIQRQRRPPSGAARPAPGRPARF